MWRSPYVHTHFDFYPFGKITIFQAPGYLASRSLNTNTVMRDLAKGRPTTHVNRTGLAKTSASKISKKTKVYLISFKKKKKNCQML